MDRSLGPSIIKIDQGNQKVAIPDTNQELIDIDIRSKRITFYSGIWPDKFFRLSTEADYILQLSQQLLRSLGIRWHIIQSEDGLRTYCINMDKIKVSIYRKPESNTESNKIIIRLDLLWYNFDNRTFKSEALPAIYEHLQTCHLAYLRQQILPFRQPRQPNLASIQPIAEVSPLMNQNEAPKSGITFTVDKMEG